MSTKTALGALALATLAGPATAARADRPSFDCTSRAVEVPPGSGSYEAALAGFVVHGGDADVTIRCFVRVNGVEVATTPTGAGFTAGPVSYRAADPLYVLLCAEVVVRHDGAARTLVECPQETGR